MAFFQFQGLQTARISFVEIRERQEEYYAALAASDRAG